MTQNTIIRSIYLNKSLIDFAKKTTKYNDLWQDIISEMLISLAEMPESKLIELYRSDGIVNYCYKIIYLSWNSPNSPFYKKYRTFECAEITQDIKQVDEYDYEVDDLFIKYNNRIKYLTSEISINRYPAEVRIFEIFTEIQSIRKTAKTLGLPTMTVWKIVDKFKNKIKQI